MIRVDRVWRHQGELARPASNARARWSAREAWIVELRDEAGRRGQGEAAPLEGYSPERPAEAGRALESLVGAELREVQGRPRLDGPLPASARCALETAWLDLAARRRGCSATALLEVPAALRLPVCGNLETGTLAEQLAQAQRAWSRGLRSLKVKIGAPGAWSRELELLAALRSSFGDSLRLRADANGTLPPAELPARLEELARFQLELLEEPVSGEAWDAVAGSPIPLAADESLHAPVPALWAAFRRGAASAAVLKTSTLGGPLSCLALAEQLTGLGVRLAVGHAFEGPIGFLSGACLALALGARGRLSWASGLDRHAGLSAWPPVELPTPEAELAPWIAEGLGLQVTA